MNPLSKDLNWLKMELRIERALSAIIGQSLKIMEQSQARGGYPSDELMAASDALDEALAELDKLATYCSDTMAVDPCGAAKTVEDLQVMLPEIADLIRGHVAIFKRSVRKAKA